MKNLSKLIAVAAALTGLQAQALTWSITGGAYSGEVGALHETFDMLSTDTHEALDLSISGGALFNASIGGITARPPGSIGKFLSVGTSGNQTGPIVIDLSAMPASYYGILWGSPDAYNSIELHDSMGGNTVLNGTQIFGPNKANGFQGQVQGGQYLNFFANNGESFTKIAMRSSSNAFETDNHSLLAAVPEPETYALMAAGLAALGFVARRHRVER